MLRKYAVVLNKISSSDTLNDEYQEYVNLLKTNNLKTISINTDNLPSNALLNTTGRGMTTSSISGIFSLDNSLITSNAGLIVSPPNGSKPERRTFFILSPRFLFSCLLIVISTQM